MFDIKMININSYVCISRFSMDEDTTEGIAVHICKDFVCIKEYYEFSFVGYCVISINDISEVFNHEHEKIIEKIAFKNKWSDIDQELSFLQSVDDYSVFYQEVFNKGLYAAYETNTGEIHLGKIVELDSETINLECVGQNFKRDKKPFSIQCNEIVSATLKSKYVEVYSEFSS